MSGIEISEILEVGPGWNKVRASDGKVYTLQGDYNWRSNNPGNIEWGTFAKNNGAIGPGAVPAGRARAFAIFPTEQAGHEARIKLQFESPSYRGLSIYDAISKYAPSFENDSGAYASHLAAAVGVPVTTKLSDLTPQQRELFAAAQNQVEGLRTGDIYNEAGIRLPPGEIPNVVGTQLDTKRGAAAKSYATNDFGRMVKTDTGAFLPPSSPVLQSIVAGRQAIDNTRPREYPNARTVMLPPIEPSKLRNSTEVSQSLIERGVPRIASASKAALQSITQRLAPRGLVDSLANTRNAGDAIALAPVMGGKQNPVFDAGYDTEQGVMQRFQSPVGEMPTLEGTRAAFHLPPMRSIPGEPPATRSVPSFAVNSPLAGPRDGIDKGPGDFSNIASILGPRQPAPNAGGRQPPVTAPYSNPLTPSDRARLAQNAPKVTTPRETEVSLGDVMSPRFPAGPRISWADLTGGAGSPRIPGPDAPPKAGERLPRVAALSFEPLAAAPVAAPPPPYKGPFVPPAAPTYRTVMRDAQIENPAYTRWKQDTLNKPGYVPLGEVSHPLSRDSLIPAAAGANYVATKMPAQFLTVQRPVQIRVAAPAVPRPVVAQPIVARPAYTPPRPIVANAIPAPVRSGGLFGNIASGAQSTLGGLLGRLVGPNQNVGGMVQGGVNNVIAKLVADQRAGNMPVGAYLGPAANGGAMFQGHNGVLNNLTQASDWWQTVTGQSDRSRGDGGAQSLSGTQN